MNISYNELKNKEVINLADGVKMGHIIDIVFDSVTEKIKGIVVPGEKKIFHKNNEIFIPIEKIRRIGDDVVLVRFDMFFGSSYDYYLGKNDKDQSRIYKDLKYDDGTSFIRFRPLDNKKYK